MSKVLSKPSPDEFAHFGVLGMKWGKTRAKAQGHEIQAARRRQEGLRTVKTVAKYQRSHLAKTPAQKAMLDKTIKRVDHDMKNSPDRVIAARMTTGEKTAAFLLTGPLALVPIAATSIRSRRIERKQETGAYNKK